MTELYNDSIQLPVGLRNTDIYIIYAHAYRTCVTRCDVNITRDHIAYSLGIYINLSCRWGGG